MGLSAVGSCYSNIHSVHVHTLCVESDKLTQLRLIRTQCAITRALSSLANRISVESIQNPSCLPQAPY